MNRGLAIVIIAVVCIGAVVGVVAISQLNAQNASSMSVVCYDTEGNVVFSGSSKSPSWAFTTKDGQDLYKVVVTINWVVTGAAADSTISLTGDGLATVRLNTITAGIVNTVPDTFESVKATGTYTREFLIEDLISPVTDTGKDNGWGIEFVYSLSCVETSASGSVLHTASKTLSVGLSVSWAEGSTTPFVLDAGISLG